MGYYDRYAVELREIVFGLCVDVVSSTAASPAVGHWCSTDLDALTNDVVRSEALISEARKPQVRKLLEKLVARMICDRKQLFYLFKMLHDHILPLTSCAFNKSGDKYVFLSKTWGDSADNSHHDLHCP